jgi:hypothetical protein
MKLRRLRSATGWRSRVIYVAKGGDVESVSLFTAPDGTEWVRTFPRERPDAVYRLEGLPPVFLRRFEGSSAQRKHTHAVRKHNRGRK